MYAFVNRGIDRAKTPTIILRHNVEPIEFGRCVVVVAKMDGDAPEADVTGLKQINCYTQGSGHAKIIRPGNRKMLDVAFKTALETLDRIEKKPSNPDAASERTRVGKALLACLTADANEWPGSEADLIAECAA